MSSFHMNKLARALETVEHRTEALAALKAGILEEESPPAVFLDYTQGDYAAAAQRLAYYWEERSAVFGSAYLKPVAECLTEQHHKWLAMDIAVLLPGADKQGRRVVLATTHQCLGEDFLRALLLCRFVAFHRIMLEQQQQTRSMVFIRVASPDSQFDARLAQRSQHSFENCFPIHISQIRILCAGPKSYIKNTLLPTVLGGLGKDLSQRCKTHVESELARMRTHLADILEAHQLPVWLGGTWNRQGELEQKNRMQPTLEKACFPADKDLLPLIIEMVEHVPDEDLEKELRRVLDDSSSGESMDELMLTSIVETIRAARESVRLERRRRLEKKVQLVFGVASLLLNEMPYPRLSDLLQDDVCDEILRDFWFSLHPASPSALAATPVEAETSVDKVADSILLIHQDSPQQQRTDPIDPIQEAQLDEVHAKFRSALKLLSLLQEDDKRNPLCNQDKVAIVCELVELPYPPMSSNSASQAGDTLDRLADLVVLQPLQRDGDIPGWLANAVAAS